MTAIEPVHFLCSTFGSSGDVFPLLGLALELRRRGHHITFATNGYYEGLVTRHELEFEPLGSLEGFHAAIRHPDLWNPRKSFQHIFGSFKHALKDQYAVHERRAAQSRVVGITNVLGFGALIAQEKLRQPVVTLHLQPSVVWSDLEPPALPGVHGPKWVRRLLCRLGEWLVVHPTTFPYLNGWRRELGLPPITNLMRWWNSPYLVACLFPEWFFQPPKDWPRQATLTDFPLWNDRGDEPLSSEISQFLDQGTPPVVFTPGSTNVHAHQFFDAAVKACQTLDRRGLLLTEFPEQLPANLPATIAHSRYVPLDQLLPRCAAFVHHGGIGSTSQGMLAGVPQVLMPLAHDQFDNANRVRHLNLGDAIPAARFTGPRLSRLLAQLFDSPSVQLASKLIAARLIPRNGLARAADVIESRIARGLTP